MGFFMHDAILVVTWDASYMRQAYEKALEIFGDRIQSPVAVSINGFMCLTIPPDGSKEGWKESDAGDERRRRFIDWLENAHTQGLFYHWVAVAFGEAPAYIRAGND